MNTEIITLRRALLNYRELLINDALEGLADDTDPDTQWTSEEWKQELQNVTALLEKYSEVNE